jgi:hypothetical protein
MNNDIRVKKAKTRLDFHKQLYAILSAAFLTVLLVTAIAIMSLVGGV